jgi:hypothetical protein
MIRFSALFFVGLLAGCGGGPSTANTPAVCDGQSRPQLDCSSEISYQGASTSGGLSVMSLASGHAKYEETALRRVDQETERYVATQTRLCREYNACVIDKEAYARESKESRDRLERVPALVESYKNAKTDAERAKALDALYRTTVPDEKRVEEITFRLAVEAEVPGSGVSSLAPGGALPTGARVAFNVQTSAEAFVYLFQKAPDGSLTVLFPNEKIGTKNPLPANAFARIPGGTQRFKLNDKDLGTEKVFLAISRKPIDRLDQALARVNAGALTTLDADPTLSAFGAVDDGASGPSKCSRGLELETASAPSGTGCVKSRGLELDGEGDGGSAASAPVPLSLAARTEAGDDVIVKVFPFEHLTAEAYAQRRANPERSRGGIIED